MKMKFTWGMGIGLFLSLFIIALLSFVIFAWHQNVNLVHNDYYEKGVDYSAQIEKEARSAPYSEMINIQTVVDSIVVLFPWNLSERIDSGSVLFYRPSDHNLDMSYPMTFKDSCISIGRNNLMPGRYIVKLTWTAEGIGYEVDKMFFVN
jgi:hypothetical protein